VRQAKGCQQVCAEYGLMHLSMLSVAYLTGWIPKDGELPAYYTACTWTEAEGSVASSTRFYLGYGMLGEPVVRELEHRERMHALDIRAKRDLALAEAATWKVETKP